ncbi:MULTISPECIES: hypothetical protein [unclassified Ruegeria]|uniref:hypothetical protein n=1 Tax=unclassified Ruegeria TaxID=2625375 RepID=UPI00149090B9|nr:MULTISPECIES: hypothetical protein [unclassified Ruegeria]NOD90752.1 hypothetical protein [Ruegeria sp. HKCCD4318]NOE15745.1 hypothetical protein [Ruegeria sp. HKCCD4318-2]NOG07982.1 hypothetical protein [Ruegeria sp. HKCCD4315]
MTDDEPQPVAFYDEHKIWTPDPTAADMQVYDTFASAVVDLLQVLDDNKPMLSRDVYARFFASLLHLSRVLGEYEDGWSREK